MSKKIITLGLMTLSWIMIGNTLLADDELSDEELTQILTECIAEAQQRGFKIESRQFEDNLVNAIMNENDAQLKKYCPKTHKKYN